MRDLPTENKILMAQARVSLRGNWGLGVAVSVVYLVLGLVLQSLPWLGGVLWLILVGPMTLGAAMLYLKVSRGEAARFQVVWEGFNHFGTAVIAYLLQALFVLLWALLLIIPGIMALLSYSMTFWLLADDSTLGAGEAIQKSKSMMRGHRWKLFCLYLRFSGWALLSVLSCGIGLLWLCPYIAVATAKFYEDLKKSGDAGISI